ncbi:hypothetical protein C6W20_04390 [Bacillus sp. NMCN6]|nr:hypothetical protein C6W21_04350 [Bacillus sp. NMCN1]PRS00271.1 hypothetical protein C6W20_04390 [Bacillus sp. NMCN6]
MKKSIENFLKKTRKKPKSLFITCTLIPIGVSIIGVELEWVGKRIFFKFHFTVEFIIYNSFPNSSFSSTKAILSP